MAPLLLADILVYNPTLHGFNSLTKFPEKYIHSSKPPRNIPIPSDHVHALGIKEEQSVLLPFNVKQDRGERCNVAAICSVCRLHFDVSLAYPEEREPRLSQWLCGPENTEYLLHHFQYLHDHSQPLASVEPGSTDTRIFLCSAPCCFATLTITTRLPLISPTEVSVLKSERRLQERRKEAILFDPTWDSDPARTPLEVFETLFSYLRNAKDGSRRGIPRYNRRVMQCFGYDHEEIFKRAHFKFVLGTDEVSLS